MGLRDRAKNLLSTATRTVVALPVVTDQVLSSPRLERIAAERGLVPKRCGLCKHFSKQLWLDMIQTEPAFRDATRYLRPGQMGRTRATAVSDPGSERARELRPGLTEEWDDYGGCRRWVTQGGPAVWGFAEQPAMPQGDSSPCEEWS